MRIYSVSKPLQQEYELIMLNPSRHTTLKQRRFNVDSTSWRWINIESVLFQRCAPAGISEALGYVMTLCDYVLLFCVEGPYAGRFRATSELRATFQSSIIS